MKGTDDGKDRYALSENYRGGFAGRMIRTAQWKYFFYTNGDEYLYDMHADPGEEHNLIKNPAFRKAADELKERASIGWVKLARNREPRGAKRSNGNQGTLHHDHPHSCSRSLIHLHLPYRRGGGCVDGGVGLRRRFGQRGRDRQCGAEHQLHAGR